jgi:hypothetical protein
MPVCFGCSKPLKQIPKVFARERYPNMWFCENEACAAFEQKVEMVHLEERTEEDFEWRD